MRGLEDPERSEDFTADPVELFFDLADVFAFSHSLRSCSTNRRGTESGEPRGSALARAQGIVDLSEH